MSYRRHERILHHQQCWDVFSRGQKGLHCSALNLSSILKCSRPNPSMSLIPLECCAHFICKTIPVSAHRQAHTPSFVSISTWMCFEQFLPFFCHIQVGMWVTDMKNSESAKIFISVHLQCCASSSHWHIQHSWITSPRHHHPSEKYGFKFSVGYKAFLRKKFLSELASAECHTALFQLLNPHRTPHFCSCFGHLHTIAIGLLLE